jgi:hypothetical protein
MSRNRLAVAKLPEFIAFAEANGWVSEPTKGFFEAARLRHSGRITILWRRLANDAGSELTHLTLDRVGESLFTKWLKEREPVSAK